MVILKYNNCLIEYIKFERGINMRGRGIIIGLTSDNEWQTIELFDNLEDRDRAYEILEKSIKRGKTVCTYFDYLTHLD